MTRTARYNAKTNTFRELPEMEKPIRPNPFTDSIDVESLRQYRIALNNYESQMPEYQKHLSSLREIPCHPSCKSFKDQQVYEEGVDYEIRYDQEPGQSLRDVFAVALVMKSEDELWAEVIRYLTNNPGLSNNTKISDLKNSFILRTK